MDIRAVICKTISRVVGTKKGRNILQCMGHWKMMIPPNLIISKKDYKKQ